MKHSAIFPSLVERGLHAPTEAPRWQRQPDLPRPHRRNQAVSNSSGRGWSVTSSGTSAATAFDCGATYGGLCGKSCSDMAPCDVGLHCSNGTCAAPCSPIDGCPAGQSCSLTGTCGPAAGGVSGTPCATTSPECPVGFVCSSATCRKGCSETQPCPTGTTCSASGSCNPNSLFGDGDREQASTATPSSTPTPPAWRRSTPGRRRVTRRRC